MTAAYAEGGWEVPRSHVVDLEQTLEDRRYSLFVKLPPGYEEAENQSRIYPVIYLNDGPYTFQVAAGVSHLPMNMGEFGFDVFSAGGVNIGASYVGQYADGVSSNGFDLRFSTTF